METGTSAMGVESRDPKEAAAEEMAEKKEWKELYDNLNSELDAAEQTFSLIPEEIARETFPPHDSKAKIFVGGKGEENNPDLQVVIRPSDTLDYTDFDTPKNGFQIDFDGLDKLPEDRRLNIEMFNVPRHKVEKEVVETIFVQRKHNEEKTIDLTGALQHSQGKGHAMYGLEAKISPDGSLDTSKSREGRPNKKDLKQ